MHGGFGFFGFVPVLFIVFIFARIFLRGGRSSYHRGRFRPRTHRFFEEKDKQEPELKEPKEYKELPKEMLEAAREVLDKLDWEIRLLERQRLDTGSAEERSKIDLELKKKKDEYRAVVEKLDL